MSTPQNIAGNQILDNDMHYYTYKFLTFHLKTVFKLKRVSTSSQLLNIILKKKAKTTNT